MPCLVPWILNHHDAEEDQEEVSEDLGASTSSEEKAADDTQIDTISLDASTEVHATTGDADLDTAAVLSDNFVEGEDGVIPGEYVIEALSRIPVKLERHREELSFCRTGRLWLMYMNYVCNSSLHQI